MRKYLLFTLMLLQAALLFAQGRRITGIVTDAQTKQPLNGVAIAVRADGKKGNAVTGADGRFVVNTANAKATLEVSFIGYNTQTIDVGVAESTVTIVLEPSEASIGDVVVTALGVKRERRSIGYATATINNDQLTKAGTTLNPALSLYGKAAGVGVNIGSGGPTAGVNIRIRGAAGLTTDSKTRPLFVVDGVPIYDQSTTMANTTYDPMNSIDYGSGINDINGDDIESIEILKGAKATVLYGSQGLNGVVLITTKSGRKTRGLGMQVSHQITIDKPISYIDFQNEYGSGTSLNDTGSTILHGQRVRLMQADRFSFGPKFDGAPIMRYDSVVVPYVAHPNNWINFFNTGSTNRTNVAISGGGAFGSARASYSHVEFRDILPNSWQKTNNVSFNGNFNVSPFATFELTSNLYSIKTKNRRPNIEGVVAYGLNRDYDYNWLKGFYLDEDGYRKDLTDYAMAPSVNQLINVLWEQNNNSDIDDKFHIVNSLKTTLRFTPELSLMAQAALDYTNTDYITENQIVRLLPLTGGKYQWQKTTTSVQNYQALLNYEKDFLNKDLHVFAFAGGTYQQVRTNELMGGTGENGLRYPGWYSVGNELGWSADRSKVRKLKRAGDLIYGVLGSVTGSWKNTWYLELQARNDWNSSLSPDNNSYFYPGASLTYNFSNDIQIPKLTYGKFRFSWADVGGGPNIVLDRYFADDSYSVGPIYEGSGMNGVTPPEALFLGNIKPFRKREFELGFNTRWFEKGRLEVDFSFYQNNIYNQIIGLNINPASGWSVANINSGNVKNWGYELMVKGAPLMSSTFRWDVTLTASRQQSKVVKLYPGITEQVVDKGSSGYRLVGIEGQPAGDIQMFDYKRDPAGNRIVASSGFYNLSETFTTVANVNPKVFGGLYSDFFFKGFNLHVGFDYKYGGKVFSYSNQYLMGNGIIKATLPYRDEAHGGLAYYVESGTNKKVALPSHASTPPANAVGGVVYHDGMILDGVKEVTNGSGGVSYEKNDVILASPDYYTTYINDAGGKWPPDRLFKNDYIKFREVAIDYTIPKKISERLHLQKLTITAAARNLGYLYKTLPNVDAESTLGAQGYVENSFYPTLRSFTFGVNISF